MGAERTRDPLVPVTRTLKRPGNRPLIRQIAVSVLWMLAGEQTVDTPAGFDDAVKLTAAEKPPVATIEIVEDAELPASKETAAGFVAREKSGTGGGGVTWTDTDAVRTRLPLVPVIVTAYDPTEDPLRVHTDVWLPAMLVGAQEMVSPVGEDAVVRSTVPTKPPVDCKPIVVGADWPATKVTAVGFARREKSGCGTGVTATSIDAVWLRFPLVPWMVTVYDPTVVAFIVHTDDWLPTRVDGEQDVVTPDGEEVVFRLTVPEKPAFDWSAIVEVVELFATNETLFGFAVREKSGEETMASIVAMWTRVPFVPVIVTTYDPGLLAENVHADVAFPVRLEGTHEVVTPEGTETAVKFTVSAKPPVEESETVELADCPVPKATLVGFAVRENSGPPGRKNSTGDGAFTSFCPRFPPPHTSSRSLMNE